MESKVLFTHNDKLGQLLKESKPIPTVEYTAFIKARVAEIVQYTPQPNRIKSYAFRRPLAFITILILLMALCVGAALALEVLFRDLFGNAEKQIIDKIEQSQAEYPIVQEQRKSMDEEAAAMLDTRLDFEATNNIILLSTMRLVSDNAVIIGERQKKFTLSEFSVYDVPGVDIAVSRHLYFAFAAPLSTPLSGTPVKVCIDGYTTIASYWDVPLAVSENESYAIFECVPNRSVENLPTESLFSVQLGETVFVFRYDWDNRQVTHPADTAESQEWQNESDKLYESIESNLPCICLTDAVTKDGITVTITDIVTDGNTLRISADVTGDHSMQNVYTVTSDISMRIKGYSYPIGVSLGVVRILPDDFDFSKGFVQEACWEIILPFNAAEISGEEMTFHFSLNDRPKEATGKPIIGYTQRSYSFTLKIL